MTGSEDRSQKQSQIHALGAVAAYAGAATVALIGLLVSGLSSFYRSGSFEHAYVFWSGIARIVFAAAVVATLKFLPQQPQWVIPGAAAVIAVGLTFGYLIFPSAVGFELMELVINAITFGVLGIGAYLFVATGAR